MEVEAEVEVEEVARANRDCMYFAVLLGLIDSEAVYGVTLNPVSDSVSSNINTDTNR